MAFSSLTFIALFLPAVWAGWFLLGSVRHGVLCTRWLLLCSLLFCATQSLGTLVVLLCSIAVNDLLFRAIRPREKTSKMVLACGIAFNVVLLAYYKYAGFFLQNAHEFFGTPLVVTRIAVPLGISFFTFQHIAVLADRYAGKAAPSRWDDYALSVAFFPKFAAGPIVRDEEIMPEIHGSKGRVGIAMFTAGLALISFGLFKKTVLADTFSVWSDAVFSAPHQAHVIDAWIGAFSYAFQIYFDFSGYSDIALGAALLFGIRLPVNFLSPYASTSVTEFWRTWHITLGRWLKDYLYIPLGGNRHGLPRTMLNMMIIMTLGGLWHGAAWGYVLWGMLHGMGLAIHRLWTAGGRTLHPLIARGVTFLFVVLVWVPFRTVHIRPAIELWKHLLSASPEDAVRMLPVQSIICCAAALAFCMLAPNTMQLVGYRHSDSPRIGIPVAVAAGAALFFVMLPYLLHAPTPFIYSGF